MIALAIADVDGGCGFSPIQRQYHFVLRLYFMSATPKKPHTPDRTAIAKFLRDACDATAVSVSDVRLLSGGAIQQNWQIDVEISGGAHAGMHSWVLRTDAAALGMFDTPWGSFQRIQLLTVAATFGCPPGSRTGS